MRLNADMLLPCLIEHGLFPESRRFERRVADTAEAAVTLSINPPLV